MRNQVISKTFRQDQVILKTDDFTGTSFIPSENVRRDVDVFQTYSRNYRVKSLEEQGCNQLQSQLMIWKRATEKSDFL